MMTTFGIITLVFGILLIAASFSFLIKDTYSFCKNSILVRLEKKEIIRYAIYAFGSAIGFTLLFLSIYLLHPEWASITKHTTGVYEGESINYVGNYVLTLIGSFFFGGALAIFIPSSNFFTDSSRFKFPFSNSVTIVSNFFIDSSKFIFLYLIF